MKRKIRIQLLALIALGFAQAVWAQIPTHVALSQPTEDVTFQFQLRASRAGSGEAKELVGNHWGGGLGCMLSFGDTPLRPRLRLDFDEIDRQDGDGKLRSVGLGLEGVLVLPDWDRFAPVISFGPTLQRWSVGGIDQFGEPKRQINKLAARLEMGTTLGGRATLTAGCLYGYADRGRRASILYLAVTF